MCGLAGRLGHVELDAHTIERLVTALRHRGPDGTGIEAWPEATFLHTRLRIIDLSPTGDQPMTNEDGSVWTVFNGEIYNHAALRAELEARGHRFRGRSDTEVLPHLYEEYREDMFARLRGMFAVAILDRRERRLLLGRDRFGIKPLFYAVGEDSVTFASEIASLRVVPGVDVSADPQAIADFAALLFVPAPSTIHRGIRALCPGELLDCRLTPDGRVTARTQRFHQFSITRNPELTFEQAVEQADVLLEKAVVSQLESDVPLGSLLSGGIDSSLVSLFAQRHVPGDLLTFNVRPPDPSYDETAAAQSVAAAIGSSHLTLDMDDRGGSWGSVTEILRQAGQPFADTSLFAVDAVSRAMRRHVTVALSGDGGDEGFGGYQAYWQIETINRLRHAPSLAWLLAARLVEPLGRVGMVRGSLGERARDLAGADDTAVVQTVFSWIKQREHARLLAAPESVESPRRLFEPQWDYSLPPASSRLERLSAQVVEANIRLILPNDYLAKVDTASMRHSLELRVPMLDEELIEFGLNLPHEFRVKGRVGKRILRRITAEKLPVGVAGRPKQGFEVPVDRWVDTAFKENVREVLLDRGSPVADHFDRRVYDPWVHLFSNSGGARQMSRQGLYQRVIMLLSLDLALRDVRGVTEVACAR
jgi:asparagine synthase (glutamine-hydrolysing)